LRQIIRIPSPREIASHKGFSKATIAKWGVEWPLKQGWRERLEARWVQLTLNHPAYFQANIDVQWEALDDEEFLSELASASQNFTAEKLVPKGLKAVKGSKAVVTMEEDDAKPSAMPKAKAAPKRKKEEKNADEDDEDDEEIIAFGTMETPTDKVKKAPQKRPRQTKKIDPSEIPTGKIDLQGMGGAIDMEAVEGDSSD